MNETLELIDVKSIELKQIKLSLYRLIIYTNNRDNCYVHDRIERREKDNIINRNDLFDLMTATSIITTETTAYNIINDVKIIKEYFDDTNRKIEKTNAIVDRRRWMVKIAIAAIFAERVDD